MGRFSSRIERRRRLRPVTWSFDVFFDLRLNKRLSKPSWGWWFETPSRPLWRYCNIWVARYAWLLSWFARKTLRKNINTRFLFSKLQHMRVRGDLVRLYYVSNRGCYWPNVHFGHLCRISVILEKKNCWETWGVTGGGGGGGGGGVTGGGGYQSTCQNFRHSWYPWHYIQ